MTPITTRGIARACNFPRKINKLTSSDLLEEVFGYRSGCDCDGSTCDGSACDDSAWCLVLCVGLGVLEVDWERERDSSELELEAEVELLLESLE